MDFKVLITHTARDDLGTLTEYIALDNPDAALEFGQALINRAKELAQQPFIGREITIRDGSVVRQIVHPPYRILYEVDDTDNVVHILRFWHGARGNPELTDER